MSTLQKIDMDRLTPSRLWSAMDPEDRLEAARNLYAGENKEAKMEANMAIAVNLKFRPAAVQRLPVEKRTGYVARGVRPDDSLATSLLLALHMGDRRDILVAFLDVLEIPNDDGMIDDDYDLSPPDEEKTAAAVAALEEKFPVDRTGLYLAALLAVDPETWGTVRKHLERIAAS
jgi:hypothetical protein